MASTGAVKGSENNTNVSYLAKQAMDAGYIVKMDSTADTVNLSAAETNKHMGVTVSSADAATYPITVRTAGFARVLAGTGGFSRGDYITSDSDGKGVDTTTATHIVIGIAEETVSAGEYGMVRLITPVRYDSL